MDRYKYEYMGKCGSCEWLNIERYTTSHDRCYCEKRGFYTNINERGCSSYSEEDEDRDYHYMRNRWYIVTEICRKLGLSNEYKCVEELYSFRTNILDNDPKYELFLKDYDILGPFLAGLIEGDDDSLPLCKSLFKLYLCKVSCLILDKKYDEALNTYISMLQILKEIYGIETEKRNSSTLIKIR